MNLEELQNSMEILMRTSYEIASVDIDGVLRDLDKPVPLDTSDPMFLPRKRELMVEIFKACKIVKELMVRIQPEVEKIKRVEELEKKGYRA